MPEKTRCTDFDWRIGLKVGDLLDVSDSQNVWYNSTVLKVKSEKDLENQEIATEVFIGYRVYNENGEKMDTISGKKYTGWSKKYDAWFSTTSPRIAIFNKFAKKFYPVISTRIDPFVDDSNDHIYDSDSYMKFAILDQSRCSSQFLINRVNRFGQNLGFQKMLHRIEDRKNWCPI